MADEKLHLGVRKLMMAEITAHPDQYKVCESCRLIWKAKARVCGACGAYRWEYDGRVVLATAAMVLAERLSHIPGVVPRLTKL